MPQIRIPPFPKSLVTITIKISISLNHEPTPTFILDFYVSAKDCKGLEARDWCVLF